MVTKNGRAAAVLHGVTDDDLDDCLFESDPKFIARIDALRRQYRREGGTSLQDVRRGLGLSPEPRHGKRRTRPFSGKRKPDSASKAKDRPAADCLPPGHG